MGAPAKGLLLAPERLAMALAADGWIIRNKVVWSKPNPMPNSVKDRLACTWEVVYFMVRSPK
jgi:site-specific DNA-methyltransferase (adenine-specific)